jgi:CubicO group peptidase (beta-lactamase class C family)
MRPKLILTISLFVLFFLGEIAITFSSKNDDTRNRPVNDKIPLSYKLSNRLSSDTTTAMVDSNVMKFMEKWNITGASVAITKGGKLVYAKGFGYANEDNHEYVTPKYLFRVASVSKLITAVTVMKLVEDEKLSLDSRVFGKDGILNDSIYLNYKDKRIEDITVYELLNHTSGWTNRKGDPLFNSLYIARKMGVEPPAKIENIIQYALMIGLNNKPGTNYSYSNLGYCILGEVIKKVSGMEYEDYVQFAILQPLGIYDMRIGHSFYEERYGNEVAYYDLSRHSDIWKFDGSKEMAPVPYGGNNIELLGAAGGWVASAPELAKLMVAIDGFSSRPDILSKESIDIMTRSKGMSRKLIGWRGTDGYGRWWRTGTLAGTSALLMRNKDEVNWVILLNTSTRSKSKIHNVLSHTMFKAIRSIDKWPDEDLFNYEPPADTQLALK